MKEPAMADDKTRSDGRDRAKGAGGDDYQVRQLADKMGITADEARNLIRRYGNDRKKIEEAVKKLTGAG
jgi:hypothetical protein